MSRFRRLILTAKDTVEDRVQGLDAGADDSFPARQKGSPAD